MRQWIKRWLFKEELAKQERTMHALVGSHAGINIELESTAVQPHVRIGRLNVMNGQLLEVSTFKRNPNGPDWSTDYYIIDPEQKLADQIATVMVMKGLEK